MGQSKADVELEKAERRIRRALKTSVPILIVASVVPVASFYGIGAPTHEAVAQWFQRSGSLVVMLTVFIELYLFTVTGDVFPSGIISEQEGRLAERYSTPVQLVKVASVAGAVSGTVIWGYGDIIWRLST